jgi:lysine 2-monooxygenase
MPQLELDVAVVGGGVAGAYAAWRLVKSRGLAGSLKQLADKAGGRLRVGLFEYSDRIGGRLYSMQMPGVPSLPIEVGGMRFLNTHTRVCQLVKKFGLDDRPFPVGDKRRTNLYYLRGRHFTEADWHRMSFRPPFALEQSERARSPGDLLIEVALRYRDQAEQMRGIGFWNLLENELSREAYLMVRDAVGYDTLVNNWSAAEAIPFLLADFPPDAQYRALNNGFQSLPLTMASRFEAAGGTIRYKHRLHSIEWDKPNGQLVLLFDTSEPTHRSIPQPPDPKNAETVRASHVLLAMPRRSIELLHPDSVLFREPAFEDHMRSVLAQPAFKIFAAYRKPWWEEVRGVNAGRSLTDLPIRQCYYWGTEKDAPHGAKDVTNSVLMASYSDGNSVEFWAGLAHHPERYVPPPAACPPGIGITPFVENQSASARLVAELQRQLRLIHGLNGLTPPNAAAQLPDPYAVVYREWTQEPYGGGWHFWKIGVNASRVARYMRQPVANCPLYICGEAWSRQQGWVEGALESADDVLENALQLSPLK